MKYTINDLVAELRRAHWFGGELANLTPFDGCRNKRVARGWCHGSPAVSTAVKQANLPWQLYWSGSNPTPATQYPIQIFYHLLSKGMITRWGLLAEKEETVCCEAI